MTGDGDERESTAGADDVGSAAPVEFDRLDLVRQRFGGDRRFERLEWRPEYAPDRVVCVYESRYYPESVTDARLEITWFENDDFTLHYQEDHRGGSFDHRWDRHPSAHNTRDHVHPGPDAPTPGEDATHPDDWRDVLAMALTEIERRQRALWPE